MTAVPGQAGATLTGHHARSRLATPIPRTGLGRNGGAGETCSSWRSLRDCRRAGTGKGRDCLKGTTQLRGKDFWPPALNPDLRSCCEDPRCPMAQVVSKSTIEALADGSASGAAGLQRVLRRHGWASGVTSLRPNGKAIWELTIAAEPAALVVPIRTAERVMSLGYTRQARYALAWGGDEIRLFDTLRWTSTPGDEPLFATGARDRVALAELFELISREDVLDRAPSDRLPPGAPRDDLAQLLGDALRRLRLEVASAEAYSGRDPVGLDTAVLRLFHQLLYIRVAEDRRQRRSKKTIASVIDAPNLDTALEDLLKEYRATADSELFEPAGIRIDAVPPAPLREVLKQTVEPWRKLKLDFSVARRDLAGRLYERYLAELPAEDRADSAGTQRLFSVVRGIDQREKNATFYTPPAVASLITRRALAAFAAREPPRSFRDVRVVDPACGSGAFLVAAYLWLRDYFEAQRGRTLRPGERAQLLVDSIIGADVDDRALGLAQVQLLEVAELRGRLPSLSENLFCGDALPAPPGTEPPERAIPWQSICEERGAFAAVLGNPPFGAQAKLPARLKVEDIAHLVVHYPEVAAFGQDYAYFFLSLALRLAGERGAVGMVMPRGLLALGHGVAARRELSRAGVGWLTDFRAARLFPGTSASVCAVVADRQRASTVQIESVADSRTDARAVLDDLLAGATTSSVLRFAVPRRRLADLALSGWSAFRVRWATERLAGVSRSLRPLTAGRHDRQVRTGVKTARVHDFVLEEGDWTPGPDGTVVISGTAVPERYAPRCVYASDITPFDLADTGRRLLIPFERDGQLTTDPAVRRLLEARGGLPRNYQHGHLPTLLGEKLLIRAFGREPAAFADTGGRYVPIMRGVHALRLEDGADLHAVAALLNSAFYQWMLRGLGSPRSDETVEITTTDIGSLPVPTLTADELARLSQLAADVVQALAEGDPVLRAHEYRRARREVDDFVFDLLGTSAELRDVVRSELVRVA